MNWEGINKWVQGLTSIGVLIGLGLVVFELQQSHAFMESDIRRSDFNAQITMRMSEAGENPTHTLAKACLGEEPLTIEDSLVLESYFQALITTALYGPVGYDLLEITPGAWRQFARQNLTKLIRLPQGREYYESTFHSIVGRQPAEDRIFASALVYEIGVELLENLQGTCAENLAIRVKI